MKRVHILLAAVVTAVCGFGSALADSQPGPSPEPTKQVDPHRFMGRWYEIAHLPNMIEKDCQAGTSDWAKQDNGAYTVVQTCHVGAPGGPPKVWRAAGRILDTTSNAKIRMGFFGGFISRDYWIVDHADDYSWCIISMPTSKYVWIMSRRPVVSESMKTSLVARTRALGYDTARLLYDEQPPA